ncbi:MAG: T9SS type A sorting domain-containing protein [Flavobacteriales bacterium]|nr:T9SS type A sorting domain-containing protein [Flavobacteriales bacterium]
MIRLAKYGLPIALLASSPWAFSQNIFQKILPGAWNTWGTCAKNSSSGDLTFCTWVHDQSATTGRDILLLSMDEQGDTLWTRAYGSPYDDQSLSLITTTDGGYLIAGITNTTGASSGPWRACVIKTNELGDTLWTKALTGLGYAMALTECDDGGFLVAGMPGLRMLRLDVQGDLVWSRLYDHQIPPDFDSQIETTCVTRSTDNNYFIGGSTIYGEIFLCKVSVSGNVIWSKIASVDGGVRQLEATTDGGLVLTGYVQSPIAPSWDGMLARMDSSGNAVWSKSFDTGTTNGFNSFTRSSDGTFALIGGTESAPLDHDAHLLKTDSTGNVMLSRTFGEAYIDYGLSVVEAASDGYLIVARTSTPGVGASTWVIKTDSTGAGDCFQDSVTTIVSDVDLGWWDLPLQSFSFTCTEYPTGFSVRRGTTILPVCPVGVYEQEQEEPPIRLHPNPAHYTFTVALAQKESTSTIEIFNSVGDRVLIEKGTSALTAIDCASLSRGIYLVKVSSATGTATQRIVLE